MKDVEVEMNRHFQVEDTEIVSQDTLKKEILDIIKIVDGKQRIGNLFFCRRYFVQQVRSKKAKPGKLERAPTHLKKIRKSSKNLKMLAGKTGR